MTIQKSTGSLLASVFVSAIGGWIFQVVLLVHLFSETGSGLVVSLFILSSALPALLVSPFVIRFTSNISDRFVMISADIIRMLLVFALLFAQDELIAVFIINALLSIMGVAFRSAYIKKITSLYQGSERRRVNALLNSGIHIAMGIGALFGGVLLNHWTLSSCLLVNALMYLLSSFFIYQINETPHIDSTGVPMRSADMHLFFNDIKSNYILSSIVIFGISWGVIGGAFNILFPIIFMLNTQHNNLLTTFYTVEAVAMLAGSIMVYFLKFKNDDSSIFNIFVAAYFLQAVCFSTALFINNSYLCFVIIAAMRLFGGVIIPLDTTLIQNNSSNHSLAMIYNIHNLTYSTFYQLAVLMTGIMIDTMSLSHVKLIAGVGGLIIISVVCLVSFILHGKHEV